MRSDVPQRALLAPPRRASERAVAREHRSEPLRPGREPARHGGLFVDPGLRLLLEAGGEEHHRGDLGPLGRLGDRPRFRDPHRQGLVQQEMTAGPCRPYRELGLHGRRQRHRHRVHVGQQRVHVVVGPDAVLLRQGGRRLRAAAPHPGELQAGVPGQGGGIGRPGPRARSQQCDAHLAFLSPNRWPQPHDAAFRSPSMYSCAAFPTPASHPAMVSAIGWPVSISTKPNWPDWLHSRNHQIPSESSAKSKAP